MKIGELDIGQNLTFQRRSWKVERVAWFIGLFTLLMAVAGLLGPGPLSRATAASSDSSVRVEYNKFERYQAAVQLQVSIRPPPGEGQITLWVDRAYIEGLEIKRIDPEPESTEIESSRFLYKFPTGKQPDLAKISFHMEPNKFGKSPARFGIPGGPEVAFTQFYFP